MKQFFKQTIASAIGTLAGLLLFFGLGAGGLVLLLITAVSVNKQPVVENKSILVVDLGMQIKDSQSPANLGQAFSGSDRETMTLHRVLQSIERATEDERIVGLLLDGRKNDAGNGYANLAEVRQALQNFRAAGKKIIAYDVNSSERDYYLSSVANRVVLNPMGIIEFNGLNSQQIFFKEALEKYGVGVQVVRVGDYKSAVEPFTRSDYSPENRQQTQKLLWDLWGNFMFAVGESRQLTTGKLQQVASDRGFLYSQEARKIGLIDRSGYYDDVLTQLRQLTGESQNSETFRQIKLATYANRVLVEGENAANNVVAVLYAEGSIVDGEGNLDSIGSDRFTETLRQLRKDDKIEAIVLRINSPGGSATASEVILREILLARQAKPVVVSMGNVAASGGYWIAAGADRIFALENTITGSIGVFGLLPNFQEISQEQGITWDVVKTGRFADINSSLRPKTDAELAIYQESVNKIYDLFLNKVAKYRHLSQDKVKEIARGRVWSGREAVEIGLVDSIGGLEAAVAYAAKQAELGTDWRLEEYPQQNRWETEILELLFDAEALKTLKNTAPLTTELLRIERDLEILQSFKDPQGIYARLPFNFNFE
ncbi:signal peptide peptidase SppA [Myxosarcina sp. GI1]|uniref:signal peptide peptidase SppA n=1 Tax=Myxosarcina sp. GI1 TaxID=1541065 RepID=UPI0005660FE8|nr:signal peptide peptidase SppA [Myxosarcina sp. GI1]